MRQLRAHLFYQVQRPDRVHAAQTVRRAAVDVDRVACCEVRLR